MSALLASIGATVGAAAVLALAAALVRVLHKLGAIEDVVCGTPADPIRGLREVPSVAERLRVLEDRVTARDEVADRLVRLEAWRDEHVRVCSLGGGQM
ncbi:hypothetical protein BBK14_11170 [Parafrankia soli]|uniref:Uncharacterized protein n=1 Tax=Parafrankia soli TaxID=2599596 RepID=A0A1S1R9L0_9ACTN|nr:hypothetical protein [Parafrankia soli]OHV42175.1 hypothetical protein BBK14_11170 [Parafrankia soli]